MSISSLASNLGAQNALVSASTQSSSPSFESLATALKNGNMTLAQSIFSSLNSSATSSSSDSSMDQATLTATTSLMGQLGQALNGGNVSKAQDITSALQSLQTQSTESDPLLSQDSPTPTSSSDSLLNALGLTSSGTDTANSVTGLTSLDPTDMVSPQQKIAENMDSFLNNLFTTLQSNNSSSSNTSSSAKSNPYAASGSSNQLSTGLQSLIQQLAKAPSTLNALGSSSVDSTSSQSATGNSDNPDSMSSQTAQLQASYDQLLSSQGGSTGSSSLINFLQNFETNLKTMQSTGGLLNQNV
jgi:hypothetical protein